MAISIPRRVFTELLAAAVLVFAGCGAIITEATRPGALGNLGIAAVFGLTVAVLAAATGPISGGHFNPAVTIALVVARRFPLRDAAAYISAQLTGAALGAAVLAALWPSQPASLGTTTPIVAAPVALTYEMLMTALLVFVVRSVAGNEAVSPIAAGFAVGSAIALDALFGGPLTGASMKPARSFGPALLSAHLDWLWLYTVGPIGGALAGSVAFDVASRTSADWRSP